MANVEERVKAVEVRVDAHQQLFSDLRTDLQQLRADTNARFAHIDAQFARIDARFGQVDARFGQIDSKLTALDQKFDGLQRDMIVQFRWIAGIMLSGFAAMVAAMLAG